MSDLYTLIEELEEKLKSKNNSGYGKLTIPCELDDQIIRLVDAFMNANEEERDLIVTVFTKDHSSVFLAFSERMAALAVREKSRAVLLKGLIALIIEGWSGDTRDNIMVLSLLNHSALKLGIDPSEIFNEASRYAGAEIKEKLRKFLKREEADKKIEAMGYKETIAKDGFRYEYTW